VSAIKPTKIEGLRELQAALRAVDGEAQKQLRVALNTAADLVARGAARRVPRRTGRAAASLRPQSSQREARIVGGSKKASYYGWLEFGGRIGRDRSQRRPFVKGGRYLWPAYAAQRPQVAQVLDQAIVKAVQAAGMDVT
jgi:hypothetical protein